MTLWALQAMSMQKDAIAKLDEVFEAMKAGEIVPASNFNGYLPTDFPGLN